MKNVLNQMIVYCLRYGDEIKMKEVVYSKALTEEHIRKITKDERTSTLILHMLASKTNDKINLCNIVVHKNANNEIVRLCKKRFSELSPVAA